MCFQGRVRAINLLHEHPTDPGLTRDRVEGLLPFIVENLQVQVWEYFEGSEEVQGPVVG